MEVRRFRAVQRIVRKWRQVGRSSRDTTESSQLLHCHVKRWRSRSDADGNEKGGRSCLPKDVPQGFLAVYVGRERKRFVIRTMYLKHPVFRLLLEKAKEEFGFSQKGGLTMPCEAFLFERFLWLVGNEDPSFLELDIEELEKYCLEKYHLKMEPIVMDDQLDH